jgi:glycosyltransferase involved in cell wall biosynthesis
MSENNYKYTPLTEPTPISEQAWPEGTTPLVATSTLTYNHELYIRDCLDGILMQKTTFPVRVVVFDDCSTDATRDIVKEYQEKYPNLFVTVFAPHNTYGKPERREALKPYFEARAVSKYIALCEGDDYWTDPLKLQKQVDFLETNPDFSFCFHNAMLVYEGSDHLNKPFKEIGTREYFGGEILKEWTIPTASVVFRMNAYKPVFHPDFMFGDIILFLSLAENGKIMGMSDIMSVYRKPVNTASKRCFILPDNRSSKFALN